jgi:site-specific DNA recombinase
MAKKALYVRVSTDIQAEKGFSIEAQLDKLRAYCKMNDIADAEEYVDAGYSAKDLDRPAIKQLMQDIKLGLVDEVVVYKLDRLSRKTKDTLYLAEDVFIKHGVKFVSLSESIDTSTSSGKFFLSILSSVAQLERENIRERSMLGKRKQAESGIKRRPARILFGYLFDSKTKQFVVNEFEAAQVRLTFRLYREGYTLYRIQQRLKSDFGATRGYVWVKRILENEGYTGKTKFSGEFLEAKNIPEIISQEEFDAVKKIRDYKKTHYFRHNSSYLLTGFIYCGLCGARMFTLPQTKRKRRYYICYSRSQNTMVRRSKNCTLPYVLVEDLDKIVENELQKIRSIKANFEAARTKPDTGADGNIAALEKELASLTAKSSRIIDMLIEAEIDRDTFLSRLNGINAQKEKIAAQLEKIKAARVDKPELTYERVQELINEFQAAEMPGKRKNLAALVNKITVFPDGTVKILWRF